ncbi:MAG TPA: TerD family protein [Thiothrix sp.]|nr:TerD family protein [Thiothrix sp.]
MSISLKKGGRINLSKEAPSLDNMTVGLGWDANISDTGSDADLDVSIFLVNAQGKTSNDKDFIFYNNLTSTDGSVVHTGDNLTGEGDGDDEKIKVSLSKVSDTVQEIIFVVTIHEAETRKQNFGQVSNSFIRIVDDSNGNEVLKYELDEDYSSETAIEFGKLYRRDNSWRFQAVGTGFNSGLQSFVDKYIG